MSHKHLFSTADAAHRLGVCPQRVRQIADELGLGVLVAATLAFTAAEVTRMGRRRTAVGRPLAKPSQR